MADYALAEFVADEAPAIDQLRRLVGGEAGKRLDGSSESLGLLDAVLTNLTGGDQWEESELFAGLGDMRTWLALVGGH